MEAIKQTVLKYWFVISSIALTVLYMLYDRRGRQVSQLLAEVQAAKLAEQLAAINQKAAVSQEKYEEASKDYASLRARHGDLLTKLGLSATAVAQSPSDH